MTDIRTAMVLAAGLGTRMRPLTDTLPKPLIPVAGKPLIDYALDRFAAAGVGRAIVNVHYLADQLEDHVRRREAPGIIVSDERDEVLETGGALLKVRELLGDAPFFCTNTDAILLDNSEEACALLTRAWDDAQMDALLLLCRTEAASGYQGSGDFVLENNGCLSWPKEHTPGEKFIFTGLQIIHPRLLAGEETCRVSTKVFWERAMAAGRLRGVVYDGRWMHVGDPAGLTEAESILTGVAEGR